MTKKSMGTLISKTTLQTLGVDVSPHLFRHAAASTAAAEPGMPPGLVSAMLGHTANRITEEHYNRALSINAGRMLQTTLDEDMS
jgi:integrase